MLLERNYKGLIECGNWLDGPYWSLAGEVMEEDTSSSKKDKQKEQMATVLFFKFPPFWTNGPWCHEFFMMILLTRGGPNPQVHSLNGTKAEKRSWIKVRGLLDKPWRALTWLLLLNQSKPQSQSDLQLSLCGLKTLFHRRKKIMQVWNDSRIFIFGWTTH